MDADKAGCIPYRYTIISIALFIVYIIAEELVSHGRIFSLKLLGSIVLILANVFVWYPFYLLKKYGNPEKGKSYLYTTKVVTRGVYSIVRHPQYLGYMLLMIGFMLIHQNWINFILGTAVIITFYLQVKAEENYCIERFGTEYTAYMEQVPRLNFLAGIIRKIKSKK